MTLLKDQQSDQERHSAFVGALKKQLGTAALAGVLVPLAVAGIPTSADAGIQVEPPEPLVRQSHVDGFVNPEDGLFRYSFQVFNRTGEDQEVINSGGIFEHQIVNWELPLFSLDGINTSSITSPEFWDYEIIDIDGNIVLNSAGGSGGTSQIYNNPEGPYGPYSWDWTAADDPVFQADNDVYGDDPDQFETPNFILHWFTVPVEGDGVFPADPIFAFGSRGGEFEADVLEDTFSFLAEDSPTNAPYQASWLDQPPTIGDPPIPQGVAFGIPNNAEVPEPGALGLLGVGLLGLLGLRRRRKAA